MGNPLGIQMNLIGDKVVLEGMRKLESKARGKIIVKSMRKALKPMQKAAKEEAPVDTGLLKKWIKVRNDSPKGRLGRIVKVVKVANGEREKLGITSRTGYYPGVLEFGRKDGSIKAREFMRKAFKKTEEQSLSIFREEVRKMMDL